MLRQELLELLNQKELTGKEALISRYGRLALYIDKALKYLPDLSFDGMDIHQAIEELAFQSYKLYLKEGYNKGVPYLAKTLISSQFNFDLGYRILTELYKPYRICGTWADAGTVMIGTDDFQLQIQAGGDGRKSVYLVDHSDLGTDLPFIRAGYFNIKDTANIYSWDCSTKDVAYTLQSGEYFIYSNDARIILVRTGDYRG